MGSCSTEMVLFRQYEVIGRHVPTERDPKPKAYRMKLFTKNETQARSRFWYFIRRLEDEEGQRRDPQHQRDFRAKTGEGLQVWHLAQVQLPLGNNEHVQGIQCPYQERCC